MVLRKLELLHHKIQNKYLNVNKGGGGAMAITVPKNLPKSTQ